MTPQITVTTEDAITGFTPEKRGCYACHEVEIFESTKSHGYKVISQVQFRFLPAADCRIFQNKHSVIDLITDPKNCEVSGFRYSFSNCQLESAMEVGQEMKSTISKAT